MARNDEYMDYEYSDDEYEQHRQQPKNPGRKSQPKTVAKNPNAQNQYKNLINRSNGQLSNDVRPYYANNPHQPQNNPQRQNVERQPQVQERPAQAVTKPPKKKKGLFRKIKTAFIILFVLYIGLTGYILSIVSNVTYNKDARGRNKYVTASSLESDMFVENILILGVDRREDEESRSDTMILASIDKRNKKIKLTSFLRDTLVTIPEYGDMKLNASCFYGGAKLVKDTIEYNFGIDIDHYMLVDFEAFRGIVDGIGGIDVEITEDEAIYLRDTVDIPYIVAGENHLNGGAALWYCRIRYLDDDFHRTQRQRKVISSIVDTALSQNPFNLVSTAKDVLPYVETDMSSLKLTMLLQGAGLFYLHYDIEQQQIPFENEWYDDIIDGQAVLVLDKENTSEKLREYIYG